MTEGDLAGAGFQTCEEEKEQGLLFYRCLGCRKVVSKWDIAKGGCSCGYNKIASTNLTFIEKLTSIAKHPAIWKWNT